MAETEHNNGLSRRTVVKAAAWSVPVMAVGSAAPAMAVSPTLSFAGLACKNPGNSCKGFKKSYTFRFNVNVNFNACIAIYNVRVDGVLAGYVKYTRPTGLVTATDCGCQAPLPVATSFGATGPGTIDITVGEFDESNNAQLTFDYEVYQKTGSSCGSPIEDDSIDTGLRATPPCVVCPDGEDPDLPQILAFNPSSLCAGASPTSVVITGVNFGGDGGDINPPVVTFGGVQQQVQSWSPIEITVLVIPPATPQTVDVVVEAFNGFSAPAQFQFTDCTST